MAKVLRFSDEHLIREGFSFHLYDEQNERYVTFTHNGIIEWDPRNPQRFGIDGYVAYWKGDQEVVERAGLEVYLEWTQELEDKINNNEIKWAEDLFNEDWDTYEIFWEEDED